MVPNREFLGRHQDEEQIRAFDFKTAIEVHVSLNARWSRWCILEHVTKDEIDQEIAEQAMRDQARFLAALKRLVE